MARPVKDGLDYFPLDVSLDDNFELIEAEHGLQGFAIVIKIYQKIYANGYYINWNDDTKMLFAKRINTDMKVIDSVMKSCFIRNLFSKIMFDQYQILTSAGIQKRYLLACSNSNRRKVMVKEEFYLINSDKTPVNSDKTPVNSDKTPVNSDKTPVNSEVSTQIKEKDIKEKKRKEFITPTIEEIKKYCLERKNRVVPQRFLDYYISNGWRIGKNPMKDWQAAIRTWEQYNENDGTNGRNKKNDPQRDKNEGYMPF